MQFPKDAGLSCIRYFLDALDCVLEAAASSWMTCQGRHVGTMVCQCRADSGWQVIHHEGRPFVELACGCNGDSVPVYIGEPPFGPLSDSFASQEMPVGQTRACRCGETYCNRLAVGIGYPDGVPPLGTLDVERAQEVVIVARCMKCNGTFLEWSLQLPHPPTIVGDEPWIKIIQGFEFGPKSRWG